MVVLSQESNRDRRHAADVLGGILIRSANMNNDFDDQLSSSSLISHFVFQILRRPVSRGRDSKPNSSRRSFHELGSISRIKWENESNPVNLDEPLWFEQHATSAPLFRRFADVIET
jgi:hypothetical protein